jgi:molybdopterin molybdotransferase
MLSVEEARDRILSVVSTVGEERVPLLNALDGVLAEDVTATEDNPPFANSAMDGFALRSDDVSDASADRPVPLSIVETIPAGYAPAREVMSGTASRIMTGAMVPAGADAVVMVEKTRVEGNVVFISDKAQRGQHIRPPGESVRAGETILRRGQRIRPAEMAMLAALNVAEPLVFRRPRVAVISTGDELTPLGEPLQPGKIRDSNRYGLYGQVIEAGAEPLDLGIARDDPEVIESRLREGLARADALVTSGGVSVGDYDVVKDVLLKLGELRFWRVAMKPGKPQAFGQALGKPVFALPGNPVSSLVVFELFVRPALRKMAGHTDWFRPTRRAVMAEAIEPDATGRTNYARVVLTEQDGRLTARPTGSQGSGVLRSLVLANGLAVVEPAGVSANAEVDVILTDLR